MDPGTGHGGSSGSSLASDHRSFCHVSESSDAGLLCSSVRPSVIGHRCLSPMLELSSGVHLSSFSADSSSNQQVLGVNKLRGHFGGSMVASTGVVPGSPATGSVPSGGLASASGSSSTTPLSLLPSQSATATSSRMETVRCF